MKVFVVLKLEHMNYEGSETNIVALFPTHEQAVICAEAEAKEFMGRTYSEYYEEELRRYQLYHPGKNFKPKKPLPKLTWSKNTFYNYESLDLPDKPYIPYTIDGVEFRIEEYEMEI